jgi:hypothetical protein
VNASATAQPKEVTIAGGAPGMGSAAGSCCSSWREVDTCCYFHRRCWLLGGGRGSRLFHRWLEHTSQSPCLGSPVAGEAQGIEVFVHAVHGIQLTSMFGARQLCYHNRGGFS